MLADGRRTAVDCGEVNGCCRSGRRDRLKLALVYDRTDGEVHHLVCSYWYKLYSCRLIFC